MEIAILVGILFLLIALRIPVAISLLVASLAVIIFRGNPPTIIMSQVLSSSLDSFPLLAIPLFTLAATLLNECGVTPHIFNFASKMLGRVRGAVGYVNVSAAIIFSGMSGSAVAEAAGLGQVQIKSMVEKGYRPSFAAALAAASATIGPIIPPSVPMVLYGVLSGASIGALFLGGVIPGLIMGLGFMLLVFLQNRKMKLERQAVTFKDFLKSAVTSFPALLAPLIILGGIWGGIFSPTEAAGVAVAYTIFLGTVVYKNLTWKKFVFALVDSAIISASILVIVAAANLYGWVVSILRIPQIVQEAMQSFTTDPVVMLLIINVILLIAGCVMEMIAIMLITVPVFLPVLVSVGVDPVVFGVIMVLNLMIGLLTPPFGLNLFIVQKIANVKLTTLIKDVMPFLAVLLVILVLMVFFPGLITFLPDLLS